MSISRQDVLDYVLQTGDPFLTAAAQWLETSNYHTKFKEYEFESLIVPRYPANNVLRHLYVLFIFRILQNKYYTDRRWIYPRRYTVQTYVNRRRYARLFMPLFDANVFARMAELDTNILEFLSYDTELVKSLPLNNSTEEIFWLHNPNAPEYGLSLCPDGSELNLLLANPHWTDDTMTKFIAEYSRHLYESTIQTLCRNSSISIECIGELFKILNKNRGVSTADPDAYTFGGQSFKRLVEDRFDYPADRLTAAFVTQNSTTEQIDAYIRTHTAYRSRLDTSRHPNMSDERYAKLMNSKRTILVERMLPFDRTDEYQVLRYSSQFPTQCQRRMTIMQLNAEWKHVLDRQLELAKDPNVFYPKTKSDLFAAIDSFRR